MLRRPPKLIKRVVAPFCDYFDGKVVTTMGRKRGLTVMIFLLVGLLVAGAGLAFLVVRPGLDDKLKAANVECIPLRQALNARYDDLATMNSALAAIGGPERTVTRELSAKLKIWDNLMLRPATNENAGAEARLANKLEALARRARANVAANPKLSADPAVIAGFGAFDSQVLPNNRVDRYNKAATTYEKSRKAFLNSIVGEIFGLENLPVLRLGT